MIPKIPYNNLHERKFLEFKIVEWSSEIRLKKICQFAWYCPSHKHFWVPGKILLEMLFLGATEMVFTMLTFLCPDCFMSAFDKHQWGSFRGLSAVLCNLFPFQAEDNRIFEQKAYQV